MRKLIATAALAALLAGCGSSDNHNDTGTAELTTASIPTTPVDKPTAYVPTAEEAMNAGMTLIAARDVCKLPAEDLAKISVYSEWVVKNDAQRKAIYVAAAKEAAKMYEDINKQGKQEAYKAQACPRVQRVLAAIDASMKPYATPKVDAGTM